MIDWDFLFFLKNISIGSVKIILLLNKKKIIDFDKDMCVKFIFIVEVLKVFKC